MVVECVDGVWCVAAPWLPDIVTAPTWFEAWELAVRKRYENRAASAA
jgi:hypothetical protein